MGHKDLRACNPRMIANALTEGDYYLNVGSYERTADALALFRPNYRLLGSYQLRNISAHPRRRLDPHLCDARLNRIGRQHREAAQARTIKSTPGNPARICR